MRSGTVKCGGMVQEWGNRPDVGEDHKKNSLRCAKRGRSTGVRHAVVSRGSPLKFDVPEAEGGMYQKSLGYRIFGPRCQY